MGEKILTGIINSNDNRVDLTRFSPGVYFVRINNKTFKVLLND
jgi:hypothetical protein